MFYYHRRAGPGKRDVRTKTIAKCIGFVVCTRFILVHVTKHSLPAGHCVRAVGPWLGAEGHESTRHAKIRSFVARSAHAWFRTVSLLYSSVEV